MPVLAGARLEHLHQRVAQATVGAALAGAYGSLTVNADGTYSCVVDHANATVSALGSNARNASMVRSTLCYLSNVSGRARGLPLSTVVYRRLNGTNRQR